jgi:Right handed beta helix region
MRSNLPRCVLFALLLVLFFRSSVPARAAPASGSTFVVTNATDDTCIFACPVCDGTAACSLRQAIGKTNESGSGTFNAIRFSAGVDWSANENEIAVFTPLPIIWSQGTFIDGSTPANALVYPRINAAYADGDFVFRIAASYVTLSNLSIYNADPGYGEIRVLQVLPDHTGVDLIGVQIAYNWLGVPKDSSSCSAARYGAKGLRVDAIGGTSAPGNGTAYIYGNVIGCHTIGDGIYLAHDFTSMAIVFPSRFVFVGQKSNGTPSGNWIGVSPNGNALPNYRGIAICEAESHTLTSNVIAHNFVGVSLPCGAGPFGGGSYNKIGGAGRGNYIYGNTRDGIYLGGDLWQNTVQGNTIGLDAAGFAVPNGRYGIMIELGTRETLIGGDGKAGEGNVIAGNALDGIHVEGANVARTVVQGNRIGTSPSGTAARGNNGHGIAIAGGAHDTTIGGESNSFGNLIAGNLGDGIYVNGANTTVLTVTMNLIGTTANGQAAVGNGLAGILIDGVTNAGAGVAGNTISGNALSGVWIKNSRYVTLTTNMVGLNSGGTAALPNGSDGVKLTDGAQYNMIGGATSAGRNVISGNTFSGVSLTHLTTNYNRIASNFIGLNAAGNVALPNGYAGIALSLADLNSIGSGSTGNQYISGNSHEGIYVSNNTYYTDIDTTNYIGVGFDGTTPIGNGLQGVLLVGDVQNSTVTPAVVAYNGEAGVALSGPATSNRVYPQAVYGNGGLPIDLGNDGPTLNDPGDADSGPNTLLNYPEVNAVSGSILSGTACADCMIIVFRAVGNPAAPRGGYSNYLGDTTADGVGHWNVAIPGGLTAADVTLMTCDDTVCAHGSNTSELRPRPQSFLPLIRR